MVFSDVYEAIFTRLSVSESIAQWVVCERVMLSDHVSNGAITYTAEYGSDPQRLL